MSAYGDWFNICRDSGNKFATFPGKHKDLCSCIAENLNATIANILRQYAMYVFSPL